MTFLYLKSNGMGNGTDSTLSEKLLLAFLNKLSESDTKIDLVGCVNGAVKLTTSEGPALESLKKLESKGAKIASCGTCLEHLNLKESLKIGQIGTMDMTVQIMATADKVIMPC